MNTPEEYQFFAIAEPLVNLGIRVFPIKPGDKMPPWGMHFLQEATTDISQVAAWHLSNRDYNCAMLADPVGFLEFDVLDGAAAMCEEMGEEMPSTRMQRSGKGCDHLIFRLTDRARAIGNRSVNRGGHEWFSFRVMNKYLMAAGSLHPNGNRYALTNDVAPIPIPEWVLDFVEKHSIAEKSSKARTTGRGKDFPKLHKDFDFDHFKDFFSLDGEMDGDYHVTEVCPIAGHKHKGSVKTGFRYDGVSLGWSCFAQNCDGYNMTIKDVIAFLEEEKGENYPYPIWESRELTEEEYAWWGLDLAQIEEEENRQNAEYEEQCWEAVDWDSVYAASEKLQQQDPLWQYDAFTWATIARTDWSQVTADPAAWGVPEMDAINTWLDRFQGDSKKPWSDDARVLSADLGADTMYFLARQRQRPGFEEPPDRDYTTEELQRMGYRTDLRDEDDAYNANDEGLPMSEEEIQRFNEAIRDPSMCF